VDRDCSDFSSQQSAQSFLDADKNDPSGLDADADGLACEDNPCPCAPSHPRADSDYDGVLNEIDACPTQYGKPGAGGCPDGDSDGVADAADTCALVAGVPEFEGCPPPDSDHDGIPDSADACPARAGKALHAGCMSAAEAAAPACLKELDELLNRRSALKAATKKLGRATTRSGRKKYAARVRSETKRLGTARKRFDKCVAATQKTTP
jgi:hypothetical protein